jgi:hypothetical protein
MLWKAVLCPSKMCSKYKRKRQMINILSFVAEYVQLSQILLDLEAFCTAHSPAIQFH